MKKYIAVWVAVLAAVAIMVFYKQDPLVYRSASGVVWHTTYNIVYESEVALDDSIIAVTNCIDNSASMYNSRSVLSRINGNRTDTADSIVAMLLRRSIEVNRETGGAFDPTVAPLMKLWNMRSDSAALPGDEVIDSVLQYVGMDKVRLVGNKVIKDDARVQIDFSAIAKGLGCDEVARMLERNGVENYIVEIGGEIVAHGFNGRGKPWSVSVDMPIEENDTVVHSSALMLALDDGAVATSGNYRNYKVVDGKKVAHIINPATGRTAQSSLLSVTVVAGNCMDADAYATALMVMGFDGACRFASSRDDIAVVLIYVDEDGSLQVWRSHGMSRYEMRA